MCNYILTIIHYILNVAQVQNLCDNTNTQQQQKLIKMSNKKRENFSNSLIMCINKKLNILIFFFMIVTSVHCATDNVNAQPTNAHYSDLNNVNKDSTIFDRKLTNPSHDGMINVEDIINRQSSYFINNIKTMILKYVDDTLNKESYEIMSGLKIELNNNRNLMNDSMIDKSQTLPRNDESKSFDNNLLSFDEQLLGRFEHFAETHVINLNIPRAAQSTGRFFFFKGR